MNFLGSVVQEFNLENKLFEKIFSNKSEVSNLNILLDENIWFTLFAENASHWIPHVKEIELIDSLKITLIEPTLSNM